MNNHHMKKTIFLLLITVLAISGCTSTKELTYLRNLPESESVQYFPMDIPEYKIQYRDILYFDIKTLTADGKIENVLQGNTSSSQAYIQGEASQYIVGYSVDKEGMVLLPAFGKFHVGGLSLPEIRTIVQAKVDSIYKHSFAEVKLLSFKFTVLGEARNPGIYVNYNDYLTVLEAIGRAGGVSDYGKRTRVLVVRSNDKGTQTYRINLQDKNLLSSPAYFLMPNDVVIVDAERHKTFNLNLPIFAFIISSITSAVTTTILIMDSTRR